MSRRQTERPTTSSGLRWPDPIEVQTARALIRVLFLMPTHTSDVALIGLVIPEVEPIPPSPLRIQLRMVKWYKDRERRKRAERQRRQASSM